MTDNKSPNSAEEEIDLTKLMHSLWRQKILIAGITFMTAAIAVILVLVFTPQYKIYTQVKPGIYRWDDKGNPIPYLKKTDLKSLLTGGIFDTYATKIKLGDDTPQIEAKNDRNGDQLIIYFFWPNQLEGKKIMAGFIDYLNEPNRGTNQKKLSSLQNQHLSLEKSINEIEEKINTANIEKQKVELNIDQKKEELKLVELKKNFLKRDIERINADLKMAKKEVEFLKEMIVVAEETRAGYVKSRQEIDENTTKIISLRDELLQAPPDDSLQLLLLADTIQQNIAYLNTIEQKIETVRKETISLHTAKAELIRKQEKYLLKIADLQDNIEMELPKLKSDTQKEITELQLTVEKEIPSTIILLNQQIDKYNDRINTISTIEVVESPQASIKPEKPKKSKIIAGATIIGFFLAIFVISVRNLIFLSVKRESLK